MFLKQKPDRKKKFTSATYWFILSKAFFKHFCCKKENFFKGTVYENKAQQSAFLSLLIRDCNKLKFAQLLQETSTKNFTLAGSSLKKRLYGPFLWIGFNCLKVGASGCRARRQFRFYHKFSDEKLKYDEKLMKNWNIVITQKLLQQISWNFGHLLYTISFTCVQNFRTRNSLVNILQTRM